VAHFVADFVYEIYDINTGQNIQHVVDAKGLRTQMYRLKAKWMMLQHGIMVQEV
jgi:hypothetical protein